MLHQRIESNQYISEFKDKFQNFIIKAPILASFVITPSGDDVIHENSKTKYHRILFIFRFYNPHC